MEKILKYIPLRRHTVFLTVLLDLLSFGIVIPLLSNMFLQGENSNTLIYGLLISLFPLSQFFGAIFLGNLGDKIGWKKTFLLYILSLIAGYLIFLIGMARFNLPLLFIGRIVKGFSSGNIATI